MRDLPLAVVPKWAVEAGLPAPEEGEGFRAYCDRIGLDADRFLLGLDEQRAEVANARLACHLGVTLPSAFQRGVDALWIRQGQRPPERDRPREPSPEPFERQQEKEFERHISGELRRVYAEV